MRSRMGQAGLIGFVTLVCAPLLIASAVRGSGSARSQDPDPEVEFGRLLFRGLVPSGELDVACATRHHPGSPTRTGGISRSKPGP